MKPLTIALVGGAAVASFLLLSVAYAQEPKEAKKVKLEPGKLYQVAATVKGMPHPSLESLTEEMNLYPGVKGITIEEQPDASNHMTVDFEAEFANTIELGTKVKMFGAELIVTAIKKLDG